MEASAWPFPKTFLTDHQVTLGVAGRGSLHYRGETYAFSDTFLGSFPAGEVLSGTPETVWTHRTLRFSETLRAELTSDESAHFPNALPEGSRRALRTRWLAAFAVLAAPHTLLEGESTLAAALSGLVQRTSGRTVPLRREHAAVQRAKDYLDDHVAQNTTLADLAREARLSKYHLLRSFQDGVGVSPHAYQTSLRVGYAKRLLGGGTSLAAVAVDVGFSDQAHLTRKFKELVGVTPGRYQRESGRHVLSR